MLTPLSRSAPSNLASMAEVSQERTASAADTEGGSGEQQSEFIPDPEPHFAFIPDAEPSSPHTPLRISEIHAVATTGTLPRGESVAPPVVDVASSMEGAGSAAMGLPAQTIKREHMVAQKTIVGGFDSASVNVVTDPGMGRHPSLPVTDDPGGAAERPDPEAIKFLFLRRTSGMNSPESTTSSLASPTAFAEAATGTPGDAEMKSLDL